MASYGQHAAQAAGRPGHHGAAYGGQQQMVVPGPIAVAPQGTFHPGTKIQVGTHRVVIQKYLSEGGFALVYLVRLAQAMGGTDQAVLKRVAVPDKDTLRGMRIEVETMKRLRGHAPIVTYMDSHASELQGGGYEVFLLMEYCSGGGLIDFMNTRLQHRLTEPEILEIFTDVAEGVACMHYLKPPLLHRDLKVENVLITASSSRKSGKRFKVCDFGSAAQPRPAPTTAVECRLIEEDVHKHTTLQYRSPEMVDVYRKQPIDEKSDIWALGVLLYKLCYYTTPFEEQGQLAILNASYRFPNYPVFSDRLRRLISSMLKENPQSRPNIYQVLRDACALQGREVPVPDIYSGRASSEPRSRDRVHSTDSKPQSTPVVGAVFSPAQPPKEVIPEIVPMRRGRPPAASHTPQAAAAQQAAKQATKPRPSPSPMRVINGDPFAALDSKKGGREDELSSRFPTLDQFDLLHDKGSAFEFNSAASPPQASAEPAQDLNKRVSEHLADEAFIQPQRNPPKSTEPARSKTIVPASSSVSATSPPTASGLTKVPSAPSKPSRAQEIISSDPQLKALSSQTSQPPQPYKPPAPAKPTMVSTGTMTSSPPNLPPIHRFPPADQHQPSSNLSRPDLLAKPRTDGSNTTINAPSLRPGHLRHPSSSRPSLEGGRPNPDLIDMSSTVPSSSVSKQRPVSMNVESSLDYLRERESSKPQPSSFSKSPHLMGKSTPPDGNASSGDDDGGLDRAESTKTHKHGKRSSLGSLSGTKNKLAGKFGDAFKKFETHNTPAPPPPRTPSPLKSMGRRDLTPIAGSEATDGRSDDGRLEDLDSMTPEMRREMERQQLEDEERRVEAAQAQYRQKVAQKDGGGGGSLAAPLPRSIGGVSRAVSIQNRVQSLLHEGEKSSSSVQRTAQGYGKYTDVTGDGGAATAREKHLPGIARKPVGGIIKPKPMPMPMTSLTTPVGTLGGSRPVVIEQVKSASAPPPGPKPTMAPGGGRPAAPRKPIHLNNNMPTGGAKAGSPPKPALPPSSSLPGGSQAAALAGLTVDMSQAEKDDYIRDFTKRYPSLSAIEGPESTGGK